MILGEVRINHNVAVPSERFRPKSVNGVQRKQSRRHVAGCSEEEATKNQSERDVVLMYYILGVLRPFNANNFIVMAGVRSMQDKRREFSE